MRIWSDLKKGDRKEWGAEELGPEEWLLRRMGRMGTGPGELRTVKTGTGRMVTCECKAEKLETYAGENFLDRRAECGSKFLKGGRNFFDKNQAKITING